MAPEHQPWAHPLCESFATWYVERFCTEDHAADLARLQALGSPSVQRALTWYFTLWTHCGSGTFYVVLFSSMIVLGYNADSVFFCLMLAASLYTTDVLKDLTGCPRPYSPPARRLAEASTYLEYGFPSTHTANAAMLGYLAVGFVEQHAPEWYSQTLLAAVIFGLHVAFSRYYLGAHWVADLVSGFIVFVVLISVVSLGGGALVKSLTTGATVVDGWHLWLPYAFGRLAITLHATPRGDCPCFVDSCRFTGVAMGFVMGCWINVTLLGRTSVIVPGEFTASVAFSIVVLLAMAVAFQTAAAAVLLVVFRRLFNVTSGGSYFSFPVATRPVYVLLCQAFGVAVLFKRPRSGKERAATLEEAATRQRVVGPSEAPPATEGLVWSVVSHAHWREDDMMSKYVSYFVLGIVGSSLAPHVLVHTLLS